MPATTTSDIVLLQQLAPFQPSYGNIIGYVDVQDYMNIEMDIVIHSFPNDWASIFRIGESNIYRWPGVYIHPNAGTPDTDRTGFWVSWRYSQNSDAFNANLGGALEINKTYHLEIEYDQMTFNVTINGEVVWIVAKETHTLQQSTPCYFSDGDYLAANATISNLVVSTIAEGICTETLPR